MSRYLLISVITISALSSFLSDETFNFSTKITYKLTTLPQKEKNTDMTLTYWFGPTHAASEISYLTQNLSSQTISIIDNKASRIIVLMDNNPGGKLKMVIPLSQDRSSFSDNSKDNMCVPSPTGNTKTLLGYECKQFRCENEKNIIEMWVTEKILNEFKNYAFQTDKANSRIRYDYMAAVNGMPLEIKVIHKKNHEEVLMTAIEIKENFQHTISTAGYEEMNMNYGSYGK